HLMTAEVANNLACVLKDGAEAPLRARPYFEHALQIRRQQLGELHTSTAQSYHNLGYLLEAIGEEEGAKYAYEHALGIRQHLLTDEHRETSLTLSMLGALLTRMGYIVEGRAHLERAVAV